MKPTEQKIKKERIRTFIDSMFVGLVLGFVIIAFTPLFDEGVWIMYWLLAAALITLVMFLRLNSILNQSLYEFILEDKGLTLKPLFPNGKDKFYESKFNKFEVNIIRTTYFWIPIQTQMELVVTNSGEDSLLKEVKEQKVLIKGFTKDEAIQLNDYLSGY